MNDFAEIAYDEYVLALHDCQTLPQFDYVMAKASEDTDIDHRSFVRLCKLSKAFMLHAGLLPAE